jgi:nitronate monooxygenase
LADGFLNRTALTRAFTGRRGRAIVNAFVERHTAGAPRAHPQLRNLTAPIRAAAEERNDTRMIDAWAGQAFPLILHDVPARDVVEKIAAEIKEAFHGRPAPW